jgi:hypothetical protein
MSTGQAISNGDRPPFFCPECDTELVLVGGPEVYPHRPDRKDLKYWLCRPCKAWIIASTKSDLPLGTPANAMLRHFRAEVLEKLAPLIRAKVERDGVSQMQATVMAHHWLAKGIKFDAQMLWVCGIGRLPSFLDEAECRLALSVLRPFEKGSQHGKR